MASEMVSIKQADKSASGMEVGFDNPSFSLGRAEEIKEYWSSLDKIKRNSKIFYLILVILFIVSIAIIVFSVVMYFKFTSVIIRIIIGIASASAGVFIYGFIFLNLYVRSIDESQRDKIDPGSADQSGFRSNVNIFIYLLICLFILVLILSIGCFVYREEILGEIKAISMDRDTWTNKFGNFSYEFVINDATMHLNLLASILLILAVLILFLLILLIWVFNLCSNCRTLTLFLCGIFFKSGLLVLYTCLYSANFADIAYVYKEIHMFYFYIFGAIGITSMVLSLFGFIAALFRKEYMIKVTFILSILLSILIVIMAIVGFYFLSDRVNYFEDKCNILIEPFSEEYLKQGIGCNSKYLFTSDSIENMKCPKERIISKFESDIDSSNSNNSNPYQYGCLDKTCCYMTFSFIKEKFDYLILTTFASFLINFLLIFCSGRLSFTLFMKDEKKIKESPVNWFILSFGFVFALGGLLLVKLIPMEADMNPTLFTKLLYAEQSVTRKETHFPYILPVQDDFYKDVPGRIKSINWEIHSSYVNQTPDEQTKEYEFFYTFSTSDGSIKYNSDVFNKFELSLISYNEGNESSGTSGVFSFSVEKYFSNLLQELLVLTPKCPTQTAFISVKIERRLLLNSKTIFFDKSMVFYSPSSDQQVIKGRIREIKYDNSQALVYSSIKNAKVKIFSETFPNCNSNSNLLEYSTDLWGNFISDKINLPYNNLPIEYVLSVEVLDKEVIRRHFNLGGIGWESEINFGNLGFWSEETNNLKYSIASNVRNSTNFRPLENVYVYLIQGNIKVKNEYSVEPKVWNLLQEVNSRVVDTHSDTNGQFQFEGVQSGKYTVVYYKKGYYLEYLCKFIIFSYYYYYSLCLDLDVIGTKNLDSENLFLFSSPLLTPIVSSESELKIVLSWDGDSLADLDLHSAFTLTESNICEVFFGKLQCGGLSLIKDFTYRGETIVINPQGNYNYTFFVDKFVTHSLSVPGEIPLNGNNNPTDEVKHSEVISIPEEWIVKLQFYSYGYLFSVYQIEIPQTTFLSYRWWTAFCFNGSKGIQTLRTISQFSDVRSQNILYCG